MTQLSSKLRSIVDLLCDGNCHNQFELQNAAQLDEHQTRAVVAFLTEYGFVEMSSEDAKLRITKDARKIFAQLI